MSVKAKLEAIIYATEEPVALNQLATLLKEPVLEELRAEEQARLALNELVAEPQTPEEELDEETIEFEDEPREVSVDIPRQPEAEAVMPETPPIDAKTQEKEDLRRVRDRIDLLLEELIAEYASPDRGMEIRQIAGGYRMTTKPEHHDVVVSFAKSLKPPVRLSMQALETLSVIAYKQPVTVPEISEIRGVDSSGVIATLLDRKLITTGGRKQVIGRPILYKTTKEFLLRFGLNDVNELPSMEEFEKLGDPQSELFQSPAEPQPEPGSEAEPAPALGAPEDTNEGSSATELPTDNNQPEVADISGNTVISRDER